MGRGQGKPPSRKFGRGNMGDFFSKLLNMVKERIFATILIVLGIVLIIMKF